MPSIGYYALTALESVLGVVGIRASEQPRYTVVASLGPATEIRTYEARVAIEAPMVSADGRAGQQQAFEKLFRYITGANHTGSAVAMTAPVERGAAITMTAPVEMSAGSDAAMRFFLPQAVAEAGAPEPNDPALHVVPIPARTLAALRYSGVPDAASFERNRRLLAARLAPSGWAEAGPAFSFSYDPPFTLPPLRRNEVLIPVIQKTQ